MRRTWWESASVVPISVVMPTAGRCRRPRRAARCRSPCRCAASSTRRPSSAVRSSVRNQLPTATRSPVSQVVDHPRPPDLRRAHDVDQVRGGEVLERGEEPAVDATPGCTARTWRRAAGRRRGRTAAARGPSPVRGRWAMAQISPPGGPCTSCVVSALPPTAHSPLRDLFDGHPGDGAHGLALDVDHGLGEAGEHLLLLVVVEHALDQLDVDVRHGSLLGRFAVRCFRTSTAAPGRCGTSGASCNALVQRLARGSGRLLTWTSASSGRWGSSTAPRSCPSGAGCRAGCSRVLLAYRNSVVSTDRLVEVLWDEPPDSAAATLQSYVSRLRRFVELAGGGPALVNRAPGYVLEVAGAARRRRPLRSRPRRGPGPARPSIRGAALVLLDAALGEWRGDAFAEFADDGVDPARGGAARGAAAGRDRGARSTPSCGVGRHQEVVGQLEALRRRPPAARAVHPPVDAGAVPLGSAGRGAAGGAAVPRHLARRPRARAVGRAARARGRDPRGARRAGVGGAGGAATVGDARGRRPATVRRAPDRDHRRSSGASATSSSPAGCSRAAASSRCSAPAAWARPAWRTASPAPSPPQFADGVRLVELGAGARRGRGDRRGRRRARRAAAPEPVARRLDRRAAGAAVACCSCSTTASTCSTRPASWSSWCCGGAPTCRCSPPAASRSASPPRWCGRCRRCRCRRAPTSRSTTLRRRARGAAVRRAGPFGAGRLRARRRQPRRGRRDLHPARRRAARARAGGGAHAVDEPGRSWPNGCPSASACSPVRAAPPIRGTARCATWCSGPTTC